MLRFIALAFLLVGCAATVPEPAVEAAETCMTKEGMMAEGEASGWHVVSLKPDQMARFMAVFNAEPPAANYVASAVLVGYNGLTKQAIARVFVDGCMIEAYMLGSLKGIMSMYREGPEA